MKRREWVTIAAYNRGIGLYRRRTASLKLNKNYFVPIGLSRSGMELVVCHCYREPDELESIRIISARKANRQETQDYWSMR